MGFVLLGTLRSHADSASPTPTATAADVVENWNRIRTWSGAVVIEDSAVGGSRNQVVNRRRVEFALDRRLRRYRWLSTEEQPSEHGGASIRSGRYVAGLVKHRALHGFASDGALNAPGRHAGRRTLQITDLPTDVDPFAAGEFDVVYYFTAGCDRLSNIVNRLDGAIRLPGEWPVGPVSVGGRDGFTVQTDAVQLHVNCDPLQPGVLASVRRAAEDRTELWTFRHQTTQGHSAPVEIDIEVERRGKESLRRSVRFITTHLNQELAAEEWSLSRIGVQPGDVVRDERAGAQYVHADPRSPAVPQWAATTGGVSLSLAVLLNIGAWIAVLGGGAAFTRWKRKRELMAGNSAPVRE